MAEQLMAEEPEPGTVQEMTDAEVEIVSCKVASIT